MATISIKIALNIYALMLANIPNYDYLSYSLTVIVAAIRATSFQHSAMLMNVISQNIFARLNIHLQFLLWEERLDTIKYLYLWI